jgi:hypothetical protein
VQTLQGSDAIADRQRIVDNWGSEQGAQILIISSVAMTGLNLSSARIMILYVGARHLLKSVSANQAVGARIKYSRNKTRSK